MYNARFYNAPEFWQKVENCEGITNLPVFEMPLDVVLVEMAYTHMNLECDTENMQYADFTEELELENKAMQELLYRHAELALEIANATPPMWYIGYDGMGSYQICKATHQPVHTELSGIWLAPGCNFMGILGPYTSEANAQAIIDEANAEVETEDVIHYLLEQDGTC